MALLTEHQRIVDNVCRAWTRTPHDRHDLFQDIVLQLWKAYPRFRGESKVTTWMYQVALHVAISGLRYRNRRQTTLPLGEHLQQIPESTAAPHPDSERIQRALSLLSDPEKAIILLWMEDYDTTEIAEITGMTPGNIRVKLHRIREKIKTHLNQ